jgi:hypothetical protein
MYYACREVSHVSKNVLCVYERLELKVSSLEFIVRNL